MINAENEKQEKYPKIALALGSGAAKAICQVGILKRMQEHNIPIHYIAGSSMGAILAAIYALGLDIDFAIEKVMRFAEMTSKYSLLNLNILHESVYKKELSERLFTEIF